MQLEVKLGLKLNRDCSRSLTSQTVWDMTVSWFSKFCRNRSFSNSIFPKCIFLKCIFIKCIFSKCTFPKHIFLKEYFPKVYFSKQSDRDSLRDSRQLILGKFCRESRVGETDEKNKTEKRLFGMHSIYYACKCISVHCVGFYENDWVSSCSSRYEVLDKYERGAGGSCQLSANKKSKSFQEVSVWHVSRLLSKKMRTRRV